MRVTQSMLQNNMLNNLFKSQSNMNKYLEQINTGKKISRPSEDPVIAMKGIGYRTQVTEIEQYRRNASEAWNWMDHSDDALDKATKVMQRMGELAVRAANGSYSGDERVAVQKEVEELREQLKEIANTNVNGKYIFNGTDTDKPPVVVDEDGNIELNFDPDELHQVEIEVSKGVKLQVNVSPENIFSQEMFDDIDHFITALGDNNSDELQESIGNLNDGMTGFVNERAALGAKMNRLELIEDRLEQQHIIAEDTMAKNEGVEFEEAVMNLLTQEVIHRAALSAGSKIIQPSLVDFLR